MKISDYKGIKLNFSVAILKMFQHASTDIIKVSRQNLITQILIQQIISYNTAQDLFS